MKLISKCFSHIILLAFVSFMLLPLYLAIVAASNEGNLLLQSHLGFSMGSAFFKNMHTVLTQGLTATGGEPIYSMLLNSFIMAIGITVGKIVLALGSAFALVYFDFPGKKICFALIFATMMLP